MVSSQALTQMRATSESLLDIPCRVVRYSATATVYGGQSLVETTTYTGSCCLARPTAGQMQAYANVVGDLVTWVVSFPYGADIRRADAVVLTDTSETLTVQATLTPQSLSVLTQTLATTVR